MISNNKLTSQDVIVVETLEAPKIINSSDDLGEAPPGESVLVPLRSPLADAVWVWTDSLDNENPAGDLARAVRDILPGMYLSDHSMIANGMEQAHDAMLVMATGASPLDGGERRTNHNRR